MVDEELKKYKSKVDKMFPKLEKDDPKYDKILQIRNEVMRKFKFDQMKRVLPYFKMKNTRQIIQHRDDVSNTSQKQEETEEFNLEKLAQRYQLLQIIFYMI